MQPSPMVENNHNDRTVARSETCFDEVTPRAGRTVACTYPVSLTAPSARRAPVCKTPHCAFIQIVLFLFLIVFFNLRVFIKE